MTTMKKKILAVLLVLTYSCAFSQVVFIIDSVPQSTKSEDTIFLASELNGWMPNDKSMAFDKVDGKYILTLNANPDTFEYKVSKGSWKMVEVDEKGNDIRNRIYFPKKDTVFLRVKGWRDDFKRNPKKSTSSKNVRFLPTNIEMRKLKRKRTVRVYLPPNYHKRQAFPVIYMHDGQNVFDDATSFAGEWGVDEIMDSLYHARGFSAIVVAIYNDNKERLNEYSPWRNDSLGYGGDGDKYADFIVNDLKPYMDRNFRTNPLPQYNAIIGSSMGGLISLYIGLEYPKVFGRVGVFSPSLWFSPEVFSYVSKKKRRNNQRFYLLAGEKEEEHMVDNLKLLEGYMYSNGYDSPDYLKIKIAPDGRHSEWFWKREFVEAIEYLFGI
jgi:alpha-glucosidase